MLGGAVGGGGLIAGAAGALGAGCDVTGAAGIAGAAGIGGAAAALVEGGVNAEVVVAGTAVDGTLPIGTTAAVGSAYVTGPPAEKAP